MRRLLVVAVLLAACRSGRELPLVGRDDAGAGDTGGMVGGDTDAGREGDGPIVSGPDGLTDGGDAPVAPAPGDGGPTVVPDLASSGDVPVPAPDVAATPDVPVDVLTAEAGLAPDGGAAKLANGYPCSDDSACASNSCVDRVCCESACKGQCSACAELGQEGRCVAITGTPRAGRSSCAGQGTPCAGTCDGTNGLNCAFPGTAKECAAPSCSSGTAHVRSVCDGRGGCPTQPPITCPGGCAGTICAGGCSAQNPCPNAGDYCQAGTCTPKKALGVSCTGGDECQNGQCVDGVCCDGACTGACQTCAGTGHCHPVTSADDDHCNGTCDAAGTCKGRGGSMCGTGGECASGYCVDGHCCGATACGACQACLGLGGTCVPVTNKDDVDSCPGSCDASGACKAKQGQLCGTGCGGGSTCVDGYCCESACTSPCMACNLTGKEGKCTVVTSGGPTGGRSCGSGTCAGGCTGSVAGQCVYPTTTCGPGPTCSGSNLIGQGMCSAGNCVTPQSQICPMGCSGSACSTSCTTNSDCQSPAFCSGGNCVSVAALAAGALHTCAVLTDGSARCWGSNTLGQLGIGTTSPDWSTRPARIVGVTNAVAVSSYLAHTCAHLSDRTVKCWGSNPHDELGVDKVSVPNSPTPIAAPVSNVLWVSTGPNNTCVARSGGTVQCWGGNYQGQLGNGMQGADMDTAVPATVSAISSATTVAAGNLNVVALLAGGGIRAWGIGLLGDGGNYSTATTPVTVSGISGAIAVSAGRDFACAVVSGGVKCWGDNDFGQLGRTGGSSATPVDVVGVNGAIAVATNLYSACALLGDGSVRCWGLAGNQDEPIAVAGISGATLIAVGQQHQCAAASGWVKCWGNNRYGQLGDGTTADMNIPTPVTVTGW
jgi:alpha-tubulin suppressor-like RCC1 family protein